MNKALNKLKITKHFIPDIDWADIPQFAVITGVNGSGKTQLLNAINIAVQKNKTAYDYETDLDISVDQFGYVQWNKNERNLGSGNYYDMEKELQQFINEVNTNKRPRNENLRKIYEYIEGEHELKIRDQEIGFYKSDKFRNAFHEGWIYTQNITQNQYISRLFISYQTKFEEKILSARNSSTGMSLTDEDIYAEIGCPPWDYINELFERYDFDYRISRPQRASETFSVKFYKKGAEEELQIQALSSGEQMIVSLILWAFNEKIGDLKKLLILDEPDAHLHPQMAKMFKEIISDVLVKKFGIQVIMTTHSPTTLCWMDEGSIFLMHPQNGLQKASKKEALDKLTSGLLYVHEAFKIILVEDADDYKFHQSVYDELAYMKILPKEPRLTFKSVVTPDVNGGGKSVVKDACKQWSQFSSKTGLDAVLCGLVDSDKDDNSDLPENVFALSRYCHENYLADPLLIFALIIEESVNEEAVKSIADKYGYRAGDTMKFKSNEIEAQSIVDDIIDLLIQKTDLTVEQISLQVPVKYINGIEVNLPQHFMSESGKDIILKYFKTACTNAAARLNVHTLTKCLEKTHLIPNDLVDTYLKFNIE